MGATSGFWNCRILLKAVIIAGPPTRRPLNDSHGPCGNPPIMCLIHIRRDFLSSVIKAGVGVIYPCMIFLESRMTNFYGNRHSDCYCF